jgi:hypothetical protein
MWPQVPGSPARPAGYRAAAVTAVPGRRPFTGQAESCPGPPWRGRDTKMCRSTAMPAATSTSCTGLPVTMGQGRPRRPRPTYVRDSDSEICNGLESLGKMRGLFAVVRTLFHLNGVCVFVLSIDPLPLIEDTEYHNAMEVRIAERKNSSKILFVAYKRTIPSSGVGVILLYDRTINSLLDKRQFFLMSVFSFSAVDPQRKCKRGRPPTAERRYPWNAWHIDQCKHHGHRTWRSSADYCNKRWFRSFAKQYRLDRVLQSCKLRYRSHHSNPIPVCKLVWHLGKLRTACDCDMHL